MTLGRMCALVKATAPNISAKLDGLLHVLGGELDIETYDAFVVCYTSTEPPSDLPWVAAAAPVEAKTQERRGFYPSFGPKTK